MNFEGLGVVSVETAYDRAFEAHWNDVFRLALAWTNDWGAAEDVAQETFVRLWRHRSSVDWNRSVVPWLLVTARRLTTDRFRTLRRKLLGFSAPPVLDVSTAERWLDLRQALSVLSPLERTCVILTSLDGHDYNEAATILGTSAGAVRAAVSRGREKLEAER